MSIPIMMLSCVRDSDDDCPVARGVATVIVKDKNYDNVPPDSGYERVPEDQPFRYYVSSLGMFWQRPGDHAAGFQQLSLNDEDKDLTLDTGSLAPGNYNIILIGNNNAAAGENFYYELHPGNVEYLDFYIGALSTDIPLPEDKTVFLYRAKGALVLKLDNIPSGIAHVNIRAGNVSREVSPALSYLGSTMVSKLFDLSGNTADPGLIMSLAPTATGIDYSNLSIDLIDNQGNSTVLSNIQFNVKRNQITVVRLEYTPDEEWEVMVLIDDTWTKVNNLNVELQWD